MYIYIYIGTARKMNELYCYSGENDYYNMITVLGHLKNGAQPVFYEYLRVKYI